MTTEKITSPADSIKAILKARGWGKKKLGVLLNFSEVQIDKLLNGEISVIKIADDLESIFGIPAVFWKAQQDNWDKRNG